MSRRNDRRGLPPETAYLSRGQPLKPLHPLRADSIPSEPLQAEEAQAIEALQSIEQVWDQLFPAEQSQIARTLIERITVAPNGISIKWRGEGLNKLLRDTLESTALREAA